MAFGPGVISSVKKDGSGRDVQSPDAAVCVGAPVSFVIQVRTVCLSQLLSACLNYCLPSTPVCPQLSALNCLPSANDRAVLFFFSHPQAKDRKGHRRTCGGDLFQVVVTDDASGEPLSSELVDVVDSNDGLFTVHYAVPKETPSLTVDVFCVPSGSTDPDAEEKHNAAAAAAAAEAEEAEAGGGGGGGGSGSPAPSGAAGGAAAAAGAGGGGGGGGGQWKQPLGARIRGSPFKSIRASSTVKPASSTLAGPAMATFIRAELASLGQWIAALEAGLANHVGEGEYSDALFCPLSILSLFALNS